MSEKKIFLMGLGSVGRNLLSLLVNENFHNAVGKKFVLVGAADSRNIIFDEKGFSPELVLESKTNKALDSAGTVQKKLPGADEVDIFVDMSTASKDGKRELSIYSDYLKAGKSVVTSNKSPLANFWPEIMKLAEEGKGSILYESTVCGGLPLFNMVKSALPEMEISSFRGIVNLTANYILENMRRGGTKEEAINNAIKEGFAETDYFDDVSGLDSARKTVIVANSLFGTQLRLKDQKFEGIESGTEFHKGTRKMLISSIKKTQDGVLAQSRIEDVNESDKFYSLKAKAMAYEIKPILRAPIFVSEDYDGPLETSIGVLSDLISLLN